MTNQGYDDLRVLLGDIATHLQSGVLFKLRTDRVYTVLNDKRGWSAPPLRPTGSFDMFKLDDLTRHLYSIGHWSMGYRQEVWDCIVDAVYDKRGDPAKLSSLYFPSIPFTSGPKTACLPQLLCLMAQSGGSLEVTKDRASLIMVQGIYPLEIDQRRLSHRGEPRRLPGGCQVNPLSLLQRSLGKVKYGTSDTTALYRHLAITLPHMVPALEVVFATAVHAGREFEAILTSLFDMVAVDDITPTATVWVKARRLINTAVVNPLPELWTVLKGTWNLEAFTALMGNPHRAKGSIYSPTTRARHARTIDLAENSEVNLQVFKRVGPGVAAANNLLKLQSLMGTPQ